MSELRKDGRTPDQARPLNFERDFTQMALGSVLVSFGRTRSCARPRSKKTSRDGFEVPERAGSRPSTQCCPFDARASEPRGGQG